MTVEIVFVAALLTALATVSVRFRSPSPGRPDLGLSGSRTLPHRV